MTGNIRAGSKLTKPKSDNSVDIAAWPGRMAQAIASHRSRTTTIGVDRRGFVSGMLAACVAGCAVESMAADAVEPQAVKKPAIAALAYRVMGPRAAELTFEAIPAENAMDVFEVQGANGHVTLRGNNTIAQAAALNCFLRECCHSQISWTGDQIHLPRRWDVPGGKIRRNALFQYRYFLNYCTFSYTMAFWDWPRWERELDWMALNGINLALAAVIGQECVWQNVMRRMGQTEPEIREFIAGPAYEPWWLMDNLEGLGGPVWDGWLEGRRNLQGKILERMRSLGIEPVMQGFYGMVPSTLKRHYPTAHIINTGIWCGFRRPPMLLPHDSLFDRMAALWYQEQQRLFGEANYFGGDPFHEGVVPGGVDLKMVGRGIESAMQKAHPGSVWVMQGWDHNPRAAMLEATTKERTLVLDLYCDGPGGGSYRRRQGWSGHPWLWCIINNFGGRISLYGQWDKIQKGPFDARKTGRMRGIGAMMEAANEVDYPNFQLLYDLTWMNRPPDLTQWVESYAVQRYGAHNTQAKAAWVLLKDTVYNSALSLQSPTTSVFCFRPSAKLPIYRQYNRAEMVLAWRTLLRAADRLGKVAAYRFDIVDLTRQVLDDLGQWQYERIRHCLGAKDSAGFASESHTFLEMISDLDRLLATQSEFLLGRWIAAARALGGTLVHKNQLEQNARTLITVWGPHPGLEDYSKREWSGMLKDFYAARWKLWIREQDRLLAGQQAQAIDWFDWEQAWTRQRTVFPIVTTGDPIVEVRRIEKKYEPMLRDAGRWL